MIPTEIAKKAQQMKTSEELLELINEIRLTSGYKGIKKIGSRQLTLYCNPNSRVTRYRSFSIPKKSGGQREISAPMPKLRALLWPVKEILASLYELCGLAHEVKLLFAKVVNFLNNFVVECSFRIVMAKLQPML